MLKTDMATNPARVHREVRFGNYILGSTLGEGEFGKVKLGWRKDGKLPSQVAIKLIKRENILKDSESEVKIHREINSLKLLNHPNIVRLVEVMKSGKYIGIVLDYASGGELFDYILNHKYLKENVAKKLFAQLVSGVDYMHCKGLIHRDLKLENLLLDKHKNVIISDFGFVNSYNRDKGDFMKTSCGSPCYAAPELVLTQSPYEGKKVDIWSLGVILYAMLAGYLPFDDDPDNEDGSDIVKLYQYICKTPLTFPEYVSPEARDLLRRIIVPDPKRRINMDEIRNHTWLAPHANLLSLRQPEWDKITNKESLISSQASQNSNASKRYSMINEKTTSSLITDQRSLSSTQLNLYSQPSSLLSSTIAMPDNRSTSPTRMPNNQKGHVKSASINYPSASYALKAMVQEKRNSLTELPINSNSKSKSKPNYQGSISTIIESPTRPTSLAVSANSSTFDSHTPLPLLSPTPQLLSPTPPTAKEVSRLPHKKQRPTSYHPLSMSSFMLPNPSTNNTANAQVLDFIRIPSTLPSYNSYSSSPTKSLTAVSESNDENQIPVLNNALPLSNSNSIGSSSPPQLQRGISNNQTVPTVLDDHIVSTSPSKSRRDSVVTHVHASGELSNHNSPELNFKRMSVLSYLEDKIDHLELTNQPNNITTPTNILPASDSNSESTREQLQNDENNEIAAATTATITAPITTSEQIHQDEGSDQKIVDPIPSESTNTDSAIKASTTIEPDTSTLKSDAIVPSREADKENRDMKEAKKKNRFSILSFYGNGYSQSSSNVSVLGNSNSANLSGSSSRYSSSKNSSAHTTSDRRKVLEPSNEVNIGGSAKEKRIQSSGSSSSKKTSKSGNSASTSSVNGKEASAARKVMDFFKRRSVRIG